VYYIVHLLHVVILLPTGRISWSRQLYRRIAAPMDVFQQFDNLLKSPEAIKVIKGYNKMARVLVEYEVLHHQAWTQQVCDCSIRVVCVSGLITYVIQSILT